jgi:tetratricopeptide (TPR) repeat protein
MENSLNDIDLNDLHQKLIDMSIEQIQQFFHGDLKMVANGFLLEMHFARNEFEMSRTWQRWMPLVRQDGFLQALELRIAEMEAEATEAIQKRWFQEVGKLARGFHSADEEEIKAYFARGTDPQKFDASLTETHARHEFEIARGAAGRGDLVGAQIHYQRAMKGFQAVGNRQMYAQSTLNLANVYAYQGQAAQAEALYQQAQQAFGQLGDTTNLGMARRC